MPEKTWLQRAELPCGACCYICPEMSREAGKDAGKTTVTASIRS